MKNVPKKVRETDAPSRPVFLAEVPSPTLPFPVGLEKDNCQPLSVDGPSPGVAFHQLLSMIS